MQNGHPKTATGIEWQHDELTVSNGYTMYNTILTTPSGANIEDLVITASEEGVAYLLITQNAYQFGFSVDGLEADTDITIRATLGELTADFVVHGKASGQSGTIITGGFVPIAPFN